MALRDAPAPEAISRAPMAAPAVEGTSAQTLARAIGAEVGYDAGGATEVMFPAPGEPAGSFLPFSTAPRSVSRAIAIDEMTVAPTAADLPAASSAAPSPAAPEAPPLDTDALYDEFVTRLRRDLLHERELNGLLIDEHPYR